MQEKIVDLLKEINGKDAVTDFDADLFANDMLDSLGGGSAGSRTGRHF